MMNSAAYGPGGPGGAYGHGPRMYPQQGMGPGMIRQGPPGGGGQGGGLPPNARPGDWMCRACNNHNYADKTACNRCKVPKDVYIASTGMRVGDWLCLTCSNHNFRDKVVCNKCSGPRPASIPVIGMPHGAGSSYSAGLPGEVRPGDWLCRHCNNHNYADKTACNRCRTPIAGAISPTAPNIGGPGWPPGQPQTAKRIKPASPVEVDHSKIQFELRYFPVLAKGLGPALVAEHSGLRWAGNATLGFSIATDWPSLKPQAPFEQLPLLTVPGASAWASTPYNRAGDDMGVQISQTTAIINYIGKVAGTEGASQEAFAMSQLLLAEGEDLYALALKHLPTPYKRLSDPAAGVFTSKGSVADYNALWESKLPHHLARLARLCRGGSFQPPRVSQQPLPGELYLWSVLYQFHLIDPLLFSPHEELHEWFERVQSDQATQRVTSGASPMGELHQSAPPLAGAPQTQRHTRRAVERSCCSPGLAAVEALARYFLPFDSQDICKLDDQRD